jgi:hypothetical protein
MEDPVRLAHNACLEEFQVHFVNFQEPHFQNSRHRWPHSGSPAHERHD